MAAAAPRIPSDCRSCGACCAVQPVWAEVTAEESRRLPLGLLQAGDVEHHAMRTLPGGRCAALDGEMFGSCRCSVYADRPAACRAVEPGSPLCLYALGWHRRDLWGGA